MDITKLDIKDLKSLAYDEWIRLETAKQNIIILNQEIKKRESGQPSGKIEMREA